VAASSLAWQMQDVSPTDVLLCSAWHMRASAPIPAESTCIAFPINLLRRRRWVKPANCSCHLEGVRAHSASPKLLLVLLLLIVTPITVRQQAQHIP
jgi:hypothetical protein